jgi:hypothetical protein
VLEDFAAREGIVMSVENDEIASSSSPAGMSEKSIKVSGLDRKDVTETQSINLIPGRNSQGTLHVYLNVSIALFNFTYVCIEMNIVWIQ